MPRTITLPCGRTTKLDDADHAAVSHLAWRAQRSDFRGENYYAYAYAGGKKLYLHRVILGAKAGQVVDHRNGDGLDNRRVNIRIATDAQNNANKAAKSSTGFRGVIQVESGRFRASISDRNGKTKAKVIGTFATAEEAARAYDRAAIERFGEFARMNFPTEAA